MIFETSMLSDCERTDIKAAKEGRYRGENTGSTGSSGDSSSGNSGSPDYGDDQYEGDAGDMDFDSCSGLLGMPGSC